MFATELVYAWKETRPGYIVKFARKVSSAKCLNGSYRQIPVRNITPISENLLKNDHFM